MSAINPTATPAQLAANRANAQLSSGPTSPEGKAIASRNHTIHGLTAEFTPGQSYKVLPGEDQAEYDLCFAAFAAEWQPVTATECDLVSRMVLHSWLRSRATRLQDQQVARGMETLQDFKHFEIFARYHNTHLRAFNKAFADLMRLRTFQIRIKKEEAMRERRAQETEIRFESQKRKAAEHAAKMELLHLKQEALKRRNQRVKVAAAPAVSATAVSNAPLES